MSRDSTNPFQPRDLKQQIAALENGECHICGGASVKGEGLCVDCRDGGDGHIDSAEEDVVRRAVPGVTVHSMTGNWRVIVAKHGEHTATWYFNVLDDPHIAELLKREAHRRLAAWQSKESGQ